MEATPEHHILRIGDGASLFLEMSLCSRVRKTGVSLRYMMSYTWLSRGLLPTLPSTLTKKPFQAVFFFPFLPTPSSRPPAARGQRQAPQSHHFLLQCTNLLILYFQVFRQVIRFFWVYLSNEPSLWTGVTGSGPSPVVSHNTK
jgi:hypothetical protein